MQTNWLVLAVCTCWLAPIHSINLIARSNVRSVGIVSRNFRGAKVNINLNDGSGSGSGKLDAHVKRTNEAVRQRCTRRLQMLMEGTRQSRLAFKRELLLCQYQEIHAEMRRVQREYERSLRQGIVTNFTNPYRREYGNVTVNPHNFEFIHRPQPCDESHTLLLSIHSATQNFDKRAVLRNTWANPRIFREFLPKGYNVKLIFMLGLPRDMDNQSMIDYESEVYRDIVQVSFIDHYFNNTYKAIYHMKWVSGHSGCPKVKLIIKADDDIMFNLRKFPGFWKNFSRTLVSKLNPESPMLAGNEFGGGPPRDPGSKWYMSYDMFKYDTFPPWFQGMVYFLTPGLARRIYELSFTTPYIFTDDVYVGIVADRVDSISRWNFGHYYNFVYDGLDKKMLNWRFEPTVFYHNPAVTEMYTLWFFYCTYKSCR